MGNAFLLFLLCTVYQFLFVQKGRKAHVSVHPVPGDAYTFSHGESSYHSTDAKPLDVSKTEAGKGSGDCKTDYVEADLDLRISHGSDLGQLPWEKIRRHDRHFTAVGDGDSDAEQNVAYNKVKDTPAYSCRKNIDPQFVHVQQFSENEADHEAEQIGGDKFFSKDHQGEYQKSLEDVCPGSKADPWENAGKCVGNTGNGGDSCAGIKHQHHTEAVDGDSKKKRKLPAENRERILSSFRIQVNASCSVFVANAGRRESQDAWSFLAHIPANDNYYTTDAKKYNYFL